MGLMPFSIKIIFNSKKEMNYPMEGRKKNEL